MALTDMIDIGQFLNYVNAHKFTNNELNLIGLNLRYCTDAHMFCRNITNMLEPNKSEYVSEALAQSVKKGNKNV